MNIKEIKQMVKLMVECDLSELEITDGEHNRVHLKRGPGEQPIVMAAPQQPAPPAPAPAPQAPPTPTPAQTPASEPAAPAPAENLIEVTSPMVGTFYSSPSPDSDPYVTDGDKVTPETVVCIVEAMKVMNEIKAECSGTIVEVCVQNAQPVEYGQVLYRVKP
jgi:acetyl-CoA carboxylase biotin carboxyl carrier protein